MNSNLAKIIKAYSLLTEVEKREFEQTVKKIESATVIEKRAVMESLSKTINFSPAPGGCPVCGK
jgi:hypothetical protein